jgi:lysophospholipase L1-like esterase
MHAARILSSKLTRVGCLLVLTASAAFTQEPKTSFRFSFGMNPPRDGSTLVTPFTFYTKETGYGFEPGSSLHAVLVNAVHSPRDTFLWSDTPFLFSVAIPEGNYRVTVTFGGPTVESITTVKAESRRLMLDKVVTTGKYEERTFTVNVRNSRLPPPPLNAPGGSEVRLNSREAGVFHWDDKLTLEFNGTRPSISALEITRVDDAITVFLAGDSTVTDQPREPGASWGQMLTRFFKPDVAIANHAESGETLKSFITGLRLDKLLSQMKKGDYLFIQFGHNDEKENWPQTYVEASTTYKAYLKVFIAEARRRGATPVLVSPVQRRNFEANGKIRNSHGDYPEAVRQVAKEENVPFIDLTAMSVAFYEALGPEQAPLAFSNGGRDPTHHNNYGAYEIAKCIIQGIKDNKLDLGKYVVDDFQGFDPAHPDPVESFSVSASPERTAAGPRGN